MSLFPPPGFTGSPLDRVEIERIDPAKALAAHEGGLLLKLDGFAPAVADDRLVWAPLPADLGAEDVLYIGRIDGIARFVRLVAPDGGGARMPAIMEALATLPGSEAATYGVARSLLNWHGRHRFCANCGHLTGLHRAGWGRSCPNCHAEHFPRVDPVVIMLAEHQDRVLVGRQPAWGPGRYSALAGFLEVGESIEEAVARELEEEAGVDTIAVRYIASQPWPFPSQLMIACIATVADDAITLDTHELEDAKWVSRAEVAAALAGEADAEFEPPPPHAIASTLLQAWLGGA